MQKVIISDTSCLVLLDKIELLHLLNKLFGTISVTPEIIEEFGDALRIDFVIVRPKNQAYQTILEASLDKGEASAIAFALENPKCLLVIDDLKGRKYAEQLGISITGTLGLIVDFKRMGLLKSVRPVIAAIKATDFRMSAELELRILQLAGEV
jgi:predicted nucleic acid-binding protein